MSNAIEKHNFAKWFLGKQRRFAGYRRGGNGWQISRIILLYKYSLQIKLEHSSPTYTPKKKSPMSFAIILRLP